MHQPSPPEGFSTPANCAACRWSIRQGSQSFYLASLLLPVAIREPAYAVYAFCRAADDLIDREQGGEEAIRELGLMLDRIYAGRPGPSFVERGFADVVARFAIPRDVPEALVEGLAWDARGLRYDSLDDLKAYAVRVAGTVGLMMTLVMGRREPLVLARACDLGVAMQLTNIARDVGEDAANDRIYLPLDWLREAGIEPEAWRRRPTSTPALRGLIERLLAEAEVLYDRSGAGIAALPGSCRLGINTARLLYREIGQEILRGIDPVTTRAVTSRGRKFLMVAEAVVGAFTERPDAGNRVLPQVEYLIDAVRGAPESATRPGIPRWWNVGARTIRMVDMLTAFARRGAPDDKQGLPAAYSGVGRRTGG